MYLQFFFQILKMSNQGKSLTITFICRYISTILIMQLDYVMHIFIFWKQSQKFFMFIKTAHVSLQHYKVNGFNLFWFGQFFCCKIISTTRYVMLAKSWNTATRWLPNRICSQILYKIATLSFRSWTKTTILRVKNLLLWEWSFYFMTESVVNMIV